MERARYIAPRGTRTGAGSRENMHGLIGKIADIDREVFSHLPGRGARGEGRGDAPRRL